MASDADLIHRFTHHPPPDEAALKFYREMRNLGLLMARYVNENTAPCREQALAITKLEEAVMWANAARARYPRPKGTPYDDQG